MESTETGLRWEGSDDEWEDEEGSENADVGEETFISDTDDIVMSDEDYYDSSEETKDAEAIAKEKERFDAMTKDEKAVALALKQLKKLKRSGFVFGGGSSRRSKSSVQTSNLMHTLGLSDAMSTPDIKEKLRDFFFCAPPTTGCKSLRTAIVRYGRMSGKELRKLAFGECETRYKTMKPLLDRLDMLEQQQG